MLASKSLRLRGLRRRCSSAMFFRRLAGSGQPHLLTLQTVIARKSSSLTSIASVGCPRVKSLGRLTGAKLASNRRVLCVFAYTFASASSWNVLYWREMRLAGSYRPRGEEQGQRQCVVEPRCRSRCEIRWILLRSGLASGILMCLGMPVASRENL